MIEYRSIDFLKKMPHFIKQRVATCGKQTRYTFRGVCTSTAPTVQSTLHYYSNKKCVLSYRGSSDVLHELGVEEGEAHELGLVEVHHEQLVRRRQLRLLLRELLVEVRHVLAMFLYIN